ncbi:hypothetical protein BGZ63DRAFT_417808 [Mariannaea sp. PMI_226]|nr:hypothetical protein BGZ63DRAFT_417808 [Mariannaea sp. PMI_226]
MDQPKILMFGGTGPAGLVFRNHPVVVYARNPSKIPEELVSNELIEITQGELQDVDALSSAVAKCTSIISPLGPSINNRNFDSTIYANFYDSLFPLMRQHGVSRILAMGTLSIQDPEDKWTFFQFMTTSIMPFLAKNVYRSVLNLADAFVQDAGDLDWTIFRLTMIPGESDEQSWREDRDSGSVFSGWIGEKGWTSSLKRGALARWLVGIAEGKGGQWIRKMPAVSN